MLAFSSKKPVASPAMPPAYPPTEFMAKEEKRSREVEEAPKPKAPKRDEWMVVPPTSSRLADEVVGKKRRAANAGDAVSTAEELEARKCRCVDEELRRGVEEHTRKTRGSALVDMHAKAGKGEDGADDRKGIWDRDRDMALSGRLMDDDKRNEMLKEAKGLGDRFGTGKTGGFY
ncbi:hypothetical protein B0H17DRAFT_1080132 [Mycena rosella]|uniref:DUF3752 domain-containing protein n=1 Tax=Mycena rosella TaxID=1033263 RepID=A0AAD7D365_MYCRO|nr:hypothetical protein B0H17DRAFT_1080132 [Mycena rosella]